MDWQNLETFSVGDSLGLADELATLGWLGASEFSSNPVGN
jgi:hypothetical protein